jgi:CcmD family protein
MERRVQRSRFRYLMLGYGVIWISLGVYMFGLHRRVAAVGREIGELRARLEESDASPRPR